MRYGGHYHEALSRSYQKLFARRDVGDLKTDLWNAFVDSDLLEICDADCSAIPRILPASYLPTIMRTCRDLTEFLLKFLSLPERELLALLTPTPVTRFLIDQLDILAHRKRRITGSLRFDLAIAGPPRPENPPKLFEINEIGFDGTGRSSHIQKTIFKLFPELARRTIALDTAVSEIKNMRRLGRRIVRLQYDCYNWEEEVLMIEAQRQGLHLFLVSPADFGFEIEDEYPLLRRAPVRLQRGRIRIGGERRPPSAVHLGYSFELEDYREGRELFRRIVRSTTPQYSPFLTGLIAPKSTLLLLADRALRERFLGKTRSQRLAPSLLPVWHLPYFVAELKQDYRRRVIKHVDGMGGEMVAVGNAIPAKLKSIRKRERREWVVQERVKLNTIDVDGFLSRRRRVIADLGAFVQYDWDGKRFTHFQVGGFITRATNRSLKVNVSGGGIQVPVIFDLAC